MVSEQVTPEYAEAYVREHWLDVCNSITQLFEEHWPPTRNEWLAAYRFTKAHEQKIAEKREDINAVEDVIDELCDCPGADCEGTIRHLAMQRILAMLEAQLAGLLCGFKEANP